MTTNVDSILAALNSLVYALDVLTTHGLSTTALQEVSQYTSVAFKHTSSMHHRLGENIVYRSWRMGLDVAAYEEHETQRICVYLQAKSASHIATETQTRLFSSHICSHCSVWLIIILFYAQCSIRSALPVTHSSSVPVVTPSLPKTTVISYPEYYMPWKHNWFCCNQLQPWWFNVYNMVIV